MIENPGDWLADRLENHQLVDNKYEDEYPNLGMQFRVEDKATLMDLLCKQDSFEVVSSLLRYVGVLVFRCLDQKDFEDSLMKQPELSAPDLSIPFHMDVVRGTGRPVIHWSSWSNGIQGLYQNPNKKGRHSHTLIAPTKAAFNTTQDLRQREPFLDEAIRETEKLALPFTQKAERTLMAWNLYDLEGAKREDFPREDCERINQEIFANTPVVRVAWDDPQLAEGGTLVLWSAGLTNARHRPLVHARDNRGSTIEEDDTPIFRVALAQKTYDTIRNDS